jgi:hypothetical protein
MTIITGLAAAAGLCATGAAARRPTDADAAMWADARGDIPAMTARTRYLTGMPPFVTGPGRTVAPNRQAFS